MSAACGGLGAWALAGVGLEIDARPDHLVVEGVHLGGGGGGAVMEPPGQEGEEGEEGAGTGGRRFGL